jgi:hypothetical protein
VTSDAPASAPLPPPSPSSSGGATATPPQDEAATQAPAPAPVSAGPPTTTTAMAPATSPTAAATGAPNRQHQRVNIQITQQGGETIRRQVQVHPDATQVRLNLGNGNVVTVPIGGAAAAAITSDTSPHSSAPTRGDGHVVTVPLQYHSAHQQFTVNNNVASNNNNNNNSTTSTGRAVASDTSPRSSAPSSGGSGASNNNNNNVPVTTRTVRTAPNRSPSMESHQHQHHHHHVRVAHLHPLWPQPVTTMATTNNTSSTSSGSNDGDDEEALARFKCTLCCEFLREPVGCPSETCSSRFCLQCLRRVVQEFVQSNNNAPSSNQKPKCPTCRVEFTHMVKDEALKREIQQGPTVACRHEGCGEQTLPLDRVQGHESRCAFEKVRCRYSSFGCPWFGTRGQVLEHEANDCALDKVKVLVDKFRKLELEHTNRLSILQQQNVGSIHMLQVYRQNAQRDLLKSTTNLFDLFHYCHVITCSINHFFQTKDRWQSFFRTCEGRAAVTNFLVLLPTVLLCGMLSLLGFQSLLILLFDHKGEQQQPSSAADLAMQLLLGDSVVGLLLGMLTMLLLLANFADTKSSVTWGHFPLPGMGNPPVMCDIIALSIFTMHIGIFEYYGAEIKSFVVWWLLALASTIYPAIVLAISHVAARGMTSTPAPTPFNIAAKARSLEPVLFGLRFSLVGTYFGILPTMDAAAISVLLNPFLQRHRFSKCTVMNNCFFESLPKSFSLAYLGAKAAMVSVQFQNWKEEDWRQTMIADESLLWSLVESLLAFGVLLVATAWLQGLLSLGIWSGGHLARRAETSSSAPGPDGTRPSPQDYQLFGLACFGAWAGLMGTLLLVR